MPTFLNEYEGTWDGNVKNSCVAESMETAAALLFDQGSSLDPKLIHCVKQNIAVGVPALQMNVATSVEPQTAVTDGCLAFPTGGIFKVGDKQVFSAHLADPAWNFDYWDVDGDTTTYTTQEALITIPQSPTGTVLVKAVFRP